ncbi:MAG TPA: hypothetical protein P5311_01115 [Candidatus Dojkabacteria bacterium]|nr:hypothetical protein [Candidatus Dojkabacteria bacterium]
MGDSKKENKKEELITPRKSVHVIFLSCPHCGTEKDHIEMCEECGEPMRVIDVVEKFGEDAERFLKRMEKRKTEKNIDIDDDDIGIDDEEPNIILMGNEDALNGDNGIDPTDDDGGLEVIFPDADDDGERKETVVEADDDLTKALEQLDSEEDDDLTAEDFGFDDGEIPTL